MEIRMKKNRFMILILFLGTLTAFFLISLVKPQKEYSAVENRVLEQRPEFDVEELLEGDFQESYENYLNDQFIARDSWVDLAVGFEKLLGKRDVNGIYLGKDGYLLEKYTDSDFKRRQVADNIELLADFLNRMAEQYGKERVDCLMIPGKAEALPEKLPPFAGGFDEQVYIAELMDYLEEPDILLDLTEVLQAHQQEYIYYRTDHHWTTLGAYYAYAAWAEWKQEAFLPLSEYEEEIAADDFYGTSYNKCHENVEPDTITLLHGSAEKELFVDWNDGEECSDSWYSMEALEDNDKYRVFFDGNTAKITIKTGADNDKALLLLKDSYANCFVPFLAEHYGTIVMIDLRYYGDFIEDLLDEYGKITDVMVLFNVEKFMQNDSMDLLVFEE